MSREMKDSGIEWLGTIPESWEITKIKNIASLQTGNSIKASDKDKYTNNNENVYPYIATKDISLSSNRIDYDNGIFTPIDNNAFKIAKKNSVLICIEGGSAGKKIAFTNQPVSFVNKLCNLYSSKYNNKYLFYYCLSPAFINQFNMNITGLIGGVSLSKLKEILISLPLMEEQEKIANFLDEKTTEIDKIVEKTKQSIEELKAYKQSLITETVTNGLNPDVPMKDSGIEWIGKLPNHWKLTKTKNLFRIKKNIANKLGYDVLSITQSGLKVKDISSNQGQLSADYSKYQIVEAGDFAMNHMDLLTGWVDLSKRKGVTSPDYRVFTKTKNVEAYNPYYKYIFQMSYSNKIYYGLGQGVSKLGRWRLPTDAFQNFYLPVPTLTEQQAIVVFLDKKTQQIDNLINKKQQMIEELESYKQSLIYEYVTGKKEVK